MVVVPKLITTFLLDAGEASRNSPWRTAVISNGTSPKLPNCACAEDNAGRRAGEDTAGVS
jgi:hypothetical protein